MKTLLRILAGMAGILCLLITARVEAQSAGFDDMDPVLEAAFEAYNQQDYDKAIEIFKEEAEKGNVTAMIMMGNMYYQGVGVPADAEKTVAWYNKAIDGGSVEAIVNLAFIHVNELKIDEAIALLKKAGKKQNLDRLHIAYVIQVGTMFSEGYLGTENLYNGLEWHLKAAEQGHLESMKRAASTYKEKKNFKDAIFWLRKAVDIDTTFLSRLRLAEAYSDENAGNYKDEQAAKELYRQAAEMGSATGMYFTGIESCRNGRYEEGLELLTKAGEKNYPNRHGLRFYRGECHFGLKNYKEAYDLFEEVYSDLYPDEEFKRAAAGRLSEMYKKGLGVTKNIFQGSLLEAESKGN